MIYLSNEIEMKHLKCDICGFAAGSYVETKDHMLICPECQFRIAISEEQYSTIKHQIFKAPPAKGPGVRASPEMKISHSQSVKQGELPFST